MHWEVFYHSLPVISSRDAYLSFWLWVAQCILGKQTCNNVFVPARPQCLYKLLSYFLKNPFLLYCTLEEYYFIIRYENEHLISSVFDNSFSLPEKLYCNTFSPINAIRTLIIHHISYHIVFCFYNGIAWNSFYMISIIYVSLPSSIHIASCSGSSVSSSCNFSLLTIFIMLKSWYF